MSSLILKFPIEHSPYERQSQRILKHCPPGKKEVVADRLDGKLTGIELKWALTRAGLDRHEVRASRSKSNCALNKYIDAFAARAVVAALAIRMPPQSDGKGPKLNILPLNETGIAGKFAFESRCLLAMGRTERGRTARDRLLCTKSMTPAITATVRFKRLPPMVSKATTGDLGTCRQSVDRPRRAFEYRKPRSRNAARRWHSLAGLPTLRNGRDPQSPSGIPCKGTAVAANPSDKIL
ncbi:hypothetical protein [Sedimentitalea nanhaiensis]|uniref:Uncharacterized protein n=1 Tax=Sedimentitalea nanhaiensis TaxID=999627 RepID=A0A1I7CZS7_9RHOB|nr:hypothetical protein [Sedimentitalea nanhaiensis]SFU04894.1 hypothetical protein SAMN05216236_12137 [Sedimentitalea nanhaiensis]